MAKIKLAVGLILLLSLLGLATSATADSDAVKWLEVNLPTEGESGNWVLADGSDVQHLTMAIDGTLYCYANPSGTSYTLFKSRDGGYSWSYTGKVKDAIVDIAAAPDDASIVYYATVSDVYESTDAGSSFIRLLNPGGAGSDNVSITSIDVARLDGDSIIAVGIRDTDSSEYGGVYTLDEGKLVPSWIDTNVGSYDAYAVAFSPNYAGDWQLVAVVTDETDTLVTTKIADAGWGATIGDATIEDLVPASACVAFPDDYDATTGEYVLFVAIDGSDNGDVYKIDSVAAPGSSEATDLNIDVDVTSLAIAGDAASANILAGAASSAQVYYSSDGGESWRRSSKEPSGQSRTCVLMAPDFGSSGTAYAVTSGSESAFSITQDGGVTWNQVSLIDTAIGIGNILDLAVSPNYIQDSTLFMVTFDGEHSLWRSLDGGARWERVFSSALANVDSIKLVELSPRYGDSSQVVFLAGTRNGNPAIWKSTDNGQAFSRRSASFPIDIWAVVSDDILFIGSHDSSNGLVYYTTDSGWTYSTGAIVGSQSLSSIALSPNYEQDETILVGNTNGWVYWSDDNGAAFEPLGQQLPQLITEAGAANDIIVAFAPQFSTSNTVYAASHCYKGTNHSSAIYRFIIGTSTKWESIDTLPAGSMLGQLRLSADGTLYATNLKADSGMERSLNPKYPLGPAFETVTRGLDDGATLSGLWLCDNRLWSIDTKNTKLLTYTDSLTQPITLTSPSNKAPGIGTIINYIISNVTLDWEALSGATKYEWQLNYEANFSTVPDEFEDETKTTSARLPSLEPATTYYWRVRAINPVLSPWSATWSFTTSLGDEAIAPQLQSPRAGASGVLVKPVFQWSAIAGADGYELLVAADVSFANPLIIKIGAYALPSTAWRCDICLNYDTTYYWKVRAGGSDTWSAWSAVGAFTTGSPSSESSSPASESPSPPELTAPLLPPPPPSPPPPVLSQPTIPDWVKYLIGGLFLTVILLLITVLMLVIEIRRL